MNNVFRMIISFFRRLSGKKDTTETSASSPAAVVDETLTSKGPPVVAAVRITKKGDPVYKLAFTLSNPNARDELTSVTVVVTSITANNNAPTPTITPGSGVWPSTLTPGQQNAPGEFGMTFDREAFPGDTYTVSTSADAFDTTGPNNQTFENVQIVQIPAEVTSE